MQKALEKIELEGGLSINWSDFTRGTYVEHNGIHLTSISKGSVEGMVSVKSELLNPNRILHGGVMVALADTIAIFGCGYLYETISVSTLNLTVSYIKSVKGGTLTARARVISQGKAVSLWQVDDFDDAGHLAAVVNLTFCIGK